MVAFDLLALQTEKLNDSPNCSAFSYLSTYLYLLFPLSAFLPLRVRVYRLVVLVIFS